MRLKGSQVDGTLDELSCSLLLLLYVKYTFPISILFFSRDGEEGEQAVLCGKSGEKSPKGPGFPASRCPMLGVGRKHCRLLLALCASH